MSAEPQFDVQQDLRDETVLLRRIVREAGALLTRDDDDETVLRRARQGGLEAYRQARADYYARFGRSI